MTSEKQVLRRDKTLLRMTSEKQVNWRGWGGGGGNGSQFHVDALELGGGLRLEHGQIRDDFVASRQDPGQPLRENPNVWSDFDGIRQYFDTINGYSCGPPS